MRIAKLLLALNFVFTLSSCGDFADYRLDKSSNYCEISFPFAGGFISRKYIGYFRVISTLQYIDEDPEIEIVVTGPSHIELEDGSLQKIIIDDKTYYPKFTKRYFQGELRHYGEAFILSKEDSAAVYQSLKAGESISFVGRFDVGDMYESEVYNFFFDSADEVFTDCVNQLMDPEDFKIIEERKKKQKLEREKEKQSQNESQSEDSNQDTVDLE